MTNSDSMRPLEDMQGDSGILWAINRYVFHPRGFALAFHFEANVDDADWADRKLLGFSVMGDGSEVWGYAHEDDVEGMRDFENTLNELKQP